MKDLEKQLLPQELTLSAIVTSFHEKEGLRLRKQKEDKLEKIRKNEQQFRDLVRTTLKTMLDEGFKTYKIETKAEFEGLDTTLTLTLFIVMNETICKEIVAEFNEPDVFLYLKCFKDSREVVKYHELQVWTKEEVEWDRFMNILMVISVLLIAGGGVLWEHFHK